MVARRQTVVDEAKAGTAGNPLTSSDSPSVQLDIAQLAGIGPLFTRFQLAPVLRVTVRTVDALIAARKISYLKVGHSVRFTIHHIEEALDAFNVPKRPDDRDRTPVADAIKTTPGRKAGQKMKINGPD